MNKKTLLIFLIIFGFFIILILWMSKNKNQRSPISKKLLEELEEELNELEKHIKIRGVETIPFSSDLDPDTVLIIAIYNPDLKNTVHKESYVGEQSMGPVNIRQWPYYYYTDPYLPDPIFPTNMYTRLRYYYPGFITSGWSYWLRPDIETVRSQRGRWTRDNNNYYFINNSGYD